MAAIQATRNNEEGGETIGSQGTTTQGCSYKEFMHYKPLNFSGNEGTIGLVQWFKNLESIFHISGCADDNHVKYAACTLLGDALTWWSKYTQFVGVDVAYEATWEDFRQMVIEEYCPRNEIRKLETELLNLRMKGTDVVSYTRRFQELALLCPTVVTSEYKRIEIYIQGLSPQIQNGVASLDPKTIQAAIRTAHELTDQIVLQETMTEDAKGKQDENQGKDTARHQNKKQKVVETSDAGQNVKMVHAGKLPYCGSCDSHHTGVCTIVCNRCQKIGHATKDCKSTAPIAKVVAPGERQKVGKGYLGNHPYCKRCNRHHPGQCTVVCGKCKKVGHTVENCRVAIPMPIFGVPTTCYECGAAGHFKKNCPKLKEQTLKQPKEEPM